jgi:hypothetical protein
MSGINHPHHGKVGIYHPNFGKKRTLEVIAKLSGTNNHGFGKKQSVETCSKKGGENHPRAKLTWDIVRTARARYAIGNITCKQLAIEYGVKTHTIWRVVNYQTWKINPSTQESV